MAYSLLLGSVLSQIINSWPNKKMLNYGYLEQVRDFAPGILLAVIMGICVYFIGYISLSVIFKLIIQIVSGALIYIAGSAILNLEEFQYLLGMIKSFMKKSWCEMQEIYILIWKNNVNVYWRIEENI